MAWGDRWRDFWGVGEDDGFGISDDTGAQSGGFLGLGSKDNEGYDTSGDWWNYLIPGYGVWKGATDVAQGVWGPSDADQQTANDLRNIDFEQLAQNARDSAYSTYGIEFDEDGNRITATASDLLDQANQASEDIPSFTEWMQDQGINLQDNLGVQADLEALTDQLAAGPTDADYDAGYANAARLMGLDPDEAQSIMGALSKQLAGYEEGMTEEEMMQAGVLDNFSGMSDEEMALRQRQNQSNLRMAEQRAQRLVQDSLADSGSTARMLQTADQATMQINNMQLQQDASLAQEDFERQVAQFESQKQVWGQMVQTNQMGVQQYIQNMQSSMGLAIEGYAQQLAAIESQNNQYLNQYQADYQALRDQASSIYTAANIQLGIDQAAIQAMTDIYEASLAPFMDSIEAAIAAGELEAFDWAGFISTLTDAAGIIATVA